MSVSGVWWRGDERQWGRQWGRGGLGGVAAADARDEFLAEDVGVTGVGPVGVVDGQAERPEVHQVGRRVRGLGGREGATVGGPGLAVGSLAAAESDDRRTVVGRTGLRGAGGVGHRFGIGEWVVALRLHADAGGRDADLAGPPLAAAVPEAVA